MAGACPRQGSPPLGELSAKLTGGGSEGQSGEAVRRSFDCAASRSTQDDIHSKLLTFRYLHSPCFTLHTSQNMRFFHVFCDIFVKIATPPAKNAKKSKWKKYVKFHLIC